ncbi:MAG: amidohydrolase family protein [Alphaproteobacteria bacterium]|nr:amidohydrolase family protein [Alphaproteobacteria bacterium]
MTGILITGARIVDVVAGAVWPAMSILIEDGRITSVAEGAVAAPGAQVIDAGGRWVMPGLIDAHVHAIAVAPDYAGIATLSPYLVGARALGVLQGMLARGYTTVRDAGGADGGLAQALAEGPVAGPRLYPSGLALAEVGGQGDFGRGRDAPPGCPVCHGHRTITRVVEGEAALRAAVCDELRAGATQIKLMASGGILSGIPMETPQFSPAEIAAAVAEAAAGGTYVMAHAYESRAIDICVAAGVRSIEHATLLSSATAARIAAAGAGIVPTLAVFAVLREEARDPATAARMADLLRRGLESIDIARSAGVVIGHGTDLHHGAHHRQPEELLLRRAVMSNAEIVRAATLGNATIMGLADEVGTIAEGKRADLIILDRDPLRDVAVLGTPAEHITAVIAGGRVVMQQSYTEMSDHQD